MKKDQVYILCRKEGKDVAQNIKEALEKRRYSVFLDVDTETELTEIGANQKIDECLDFIPILTNNAWKRLLPNDSYINKLQQALDKEKNVVPIIARGAIFPSVDEIDDTIKALANKNGLPDSAVPQCFDGIMDRLDSAFLISRRKLDARTKYFFYTASIVAAIFVIGFSIYLINSLRKFPTFKKEMEAVDTATLYFTASIQGGNFTYRDRDFFNELEVIYELANDYMQSNSTNPSTVERKIEDFKKNFKYKNLANESDFLALDNTKLKTGITSANFEDYVKFEDNYHKRIFGSEDSKGSLGIILWYLEKKDSPDGIQQRWKNEYINLKKELGIIKNYKYHLINLLLSNVDYNAKDKAGNMVLQNFLNQNFIPNSDIYWETSKNQIEIMYLQDKKYLQDIWGVVGR